MLGESIKTAWEAIVAILEEDQDVTGMLYRKKVFTDPDLFKSIEAPQIQKTKPEVAIYVGAGDTIAFQNLSDLPGEIRDCCVPEGSIGEDQIAVTEFQIVLKWSRRCNRPDVDLELQAADLALESKLWNALLDEPQLKDAAISWTGVQVLRAEEPLEEDRDRKCRVIEILIQVSTLFPRGSICF